MSDMRRRMPPGTPPKRRPEDDGERTWAHLFRSMMTVLSMAAAALGACYLIHFSVVLAFSLIGF